MNNTWWYVINGQKHGSVEQEELARLILAGTIEPNTLLWKTGMSGWQKLAQIEELNALCAYAPPPLPPTPPLPPSTSPSPPPVSAAFGTHEHRTVNPVSAPPVATATLKPTTQERPEKPKPRIYARFFARQFDLWWEVPLVGLLIGMTFPDFPENILQASGNMNESSANILFGIIALPIALFFDALIYKIFGNTPGKALLGLKVTESNGDNLSFDDYFFRNMGVWVQGLWFGLLSIIPMLLQYHRLRNGQSTSYDAKTNYVVTSKPIGWGQGLLFITLFGLELFAIAFLILLGNSMPESRQTSAPTTQNVTPPVTQTPEPSTAQQSTSTTNPKESQPKPYNPFLDPEFLAPYTTNAGDLIELAMQYYNGHGVPQDYAKAAEWFRKAAEQGHAIAQNNLGVMYNDGEGVSQDYAQAAVWYRKAAEQGYAIAQSNLGFMYKNGRSVPQSYIVAYALFKLTENQDADAAKGLEIIASIMSAQEIATAQNLARDMAKPGNFGRALDKYLTR